MPKTSSLTPTWRKKRADDGLLAWCVNVPAELSETGKRQQLFYATQEDAKKECVILKIRRRNFGSSLGAMTPARIAEAAEAYNVLNPLNVGLLDAVKAYAADHKLRFESRTLGQAFDKYEAMRDRSHDYKKEIEHTRAACSELLTRLLPDIQASDLEAALKGYAPSTRDARIRRLRSVFSEAVRQGWITINPADRLNFAGRKVEEVQIYAVRDVRDLLERALATDKAIVPFLAICAFCGLRPENEAFNLLWSDVHLDGKKPEIIVQAQTSKVRRKRAVVIPKNCIAWILASGVMRSGRVMPYSSTTLKRRRIKICAADKEEGWAQIDWINDGLRHTYCSAHLARHESVDRLLIQVGHTNPAILFRHYYRMMTEQDAKAFWSIRPPKSASPKNVIRMVA